MTAPDLPIDDPPRRRLRAGPLVADVAGLGLLGLVALSGLGPTYGGVRYLVVGAIGLAAGIALAVGFAARRWSVGLLTVAVIAVYLIAGRWLIAADRPLDPVLPSPGSVSTMVSGAVRGWANVLTTIPPVGAAQNLLAVPFAIGIAAGAASLTIARRSSRWWLLAALPPAVAFVVAVLLGVDRPAWTLQATAFAVVALLLTAALWLHRPAWLFRFPRQSPGFWLLVMCLYPLISVFPQGLLYRKLFERRYAGLFSSPRVSWLIGSLVFGFAHLPFGNLWAVGFPFLGGLVFLRTYRRTGSLVLSCIEHGLYGDLLFTVGWGVYLFHGGTQALLVR